MKTKSDLVQCVRCGFWALLFAWCMPVLSWGTHNSEGYKGSPWPSERELLGVLRQAITPPSKTPEAIDIQSIHPLQVGNSEDAYLISVRFPDRGRNFSAGVFLYRPKLQHARELNYSQSLGRVPFASSGSDFVLLEQYSSGQGSEDFTHSLVTFTGWEMQVLHQAYFGNNLGNCDAMSMRWEACVQTSVKFHLLTPSKVSALDLVEVTTKLAQVGKKTEKLSVTTRRLRLSNGRFEPVNS